MKNSSIWIKDSKQTNKYQNKLDKETDILIIGGGITGLTTAYFLKDTNNKITLIDKAKIKNGVTSKTTAKITYLQGIIYQTLMNKFNKNVSKSYFDSQIEAINLIKEIIDNNKIQCDFKKTPSIVFTNKNKNVVKIFNEKKILESFNVKVETIKDDSFKIGIQVDDTYCFNPIKYLNGLVNSINDRVNICEDVIACNINKITNGYKVETSKGIIQAKKVVVACHYPFFIIPSFIPLKTYIKREYVNAAKVDNFHNYNAINIDDKLYSVRYYKNYVIYTSNKHCLTNKTDYAKNYEKSRKDFYKYFNKQPEYTWMNQDIMSNDEIPIIGRIDDGLYLATAFNAWGMTNGTIAAEIISDLIIKNTSKYKSLFDPKRCNTNLVVSSFLGSFCYLKVYVKSLFVKNNPYYIKIKNILYGVYTDDNNKKHYIKLICPHMKCSLVFNREEKTWDCPCHGSRFDLDGNILEGPAVKKLKDKNN